jgi:hypothetical protein
MSTDKKQLTNEAKQYKSLKDEVKFLQDRMSEIKDRLNEAVKELGEVDGRGHITLELDDDIKVVNQRKVSKVLDNETAMKILTEKNLLDDCAPLVRQVDQDAVMAAVYKGQLTEDEVDVMFPAKVTYALIV